MDDVEINAWEYNKLLKETPFDLQILTFGDNGHIGINEPNNDFKLLTLVFELNPEKREYKNKLFGCFDKTR